MIIHSNDQNLKIKQKIFPDDSRVETHYLSSAPLSSIITMSKYLAENNTESFESKILIDEILKRGCVLTNLLQITCIQNIQRAGIQPRSRDFRAEIMLFQKDIRSIYIYAFKIILGFGYYEACLHRIDTIIEDPSDKNLILI